MKNKKIHLAIISLVLIVTVAIRITYVNLSAIQVHEERYTINELVQLDGAFQEISDEQTQGYSLKVNSVMLTTYDNYINKYNGDINLIPEDERPDKIIDVEITLKNDNNDNGYIFLFSWGLQSPNDEWKPCMELWSLVQPNSNGSMSFSIRPNSEYTMSIPFKSNNGYEQIYHHYPIEDKYYLVVSRAPIKKMIEINL